MHDTEVLPVAGRNTSWQSCWAEDPAKRPSFAKVGDLLQGMLQEGIDQNWCVHGIRRRFERSSEDLMSICMHSAFVGRNGCSTRPNQNL